MKTVYTIEFDGNIIYHTNILEKAIKYLNRVYKRYDVLKLRKHIYPDELDMFITADGQLDFTDGTDKGDKGVIRSDYGIIVDDILTLEFYTYNLS